MFSFSSYLEADISSTSGKPQLRLTRFVDEIAHLVRVRVRVRGARVRARARVRVRVRIRVPTLLRSTNCQDGLYGWYSGAGGDLPTNHRNPNSPPSPPVLPEVLSITAPTLSLLTRPSVLKTTPIACGGVSILRLSGSAPKKG